jgi:hypothetical protein
MWRYCNKHKDLTDYHTTWKKEKVFELLHLNWIWGIL